MDVPADVSARLARAVGVYLRATPRQELPGGLRRFASFRPASLDRHRDQLVGALDDEGLRARIVEWLDDKPRIAREQAELLRLACARPEGWASKLERRSKPRQQQGDGRARGRAEQASQREQDKTRALKEEVRKLKEQSRRQITIERARADELRGQIAELKRTLADVEKELRAARSDAAKAVSQREREVRKAARDADRARAERDELKRKATEARKRGAALERTVADLERELERRVTPPASSRRRPPAKPRVRTALPVPKGLFEDAPETLEVWLGAPGVHLVVDGYNVTKSEAGFADLDLADQRHRLVEVLAPLARRHNLKTTVVFDGSEVPRAPARRGKGPVKVEYSKPPAIADDHIVALVRSLPPDPVVVTSDDRELQGRVAELGATVATSRQLLALIR